MRRSSELIGGVSRQRVSELLGQHRLIGLRDRSGRLHFPAFQFSDGQPVPALVDAFWAIAAQVSDWTAACWCVSADPGALEGESPVQWAKAGRDVERLARVARQDAARLARPDGFPRRTLRGDRPLSRIHRAARGPWWFSADGSGRFDPVHAAGIGACYLAERPLGAWVEVFRKQLLLAESDVSDRHLLTVALGRDVKLANLCSRRALAFGVTASLGANEDYTRSQAFASEAVAAGFAGIRYLVRHDPAQELFGVALFAPVGSAGWPSGDDGPIPADLLAEAGRVFGYRVLPTP